MNAWRSVAFIGSRSVRAATSSAFGGGTSERPYTERRNTGRNSAPVTAGIQNSLIPAPSSAAPTDLTAPLATTYAQDSPAPRISDVRRPSRKLNTLPHTVPSGRPLRNSAATLPAGGRPP